MILLFHYPHSKSIFLGLYLVWIHYLCMYHIFQKLRIVCFAFFQNTLLLMKLTNHILSPNLYLQNFFYLSFFSLDHERAMVHLSRAKANALSTSEPTWIGCGALATAAISRIPVRTTALLMMSAFP